MTLRALASRALALRGRLVLLLLLALLPAFLASLYTSWQHRARLRADAADNTVTLASLAGAHVEGTIASTYQLLILLASDRQIQAGGSQCEHRLAQALVSDDDLSGLALLDASGVLVCSSPRASSETRLDPILLARLRAGESFIIRQAEIGELTGKPVIAGIHAIRDEKGLTGSLAAGIDLQRLGDLAERTGLPEGATFTLVSVEGTVVARFPSPELWIGRNVRHAEGFRNALRDPKRSGSFSGRDQDGVQRVWGYTPVDVSGAEFVAVVGLSEHYLMRGADLVLYNNLLGFGVAAALALLAASLSGEYFLRRPIERMRLTAQRITGGDLAARVALDRAPGELGALSRSIDDMAEGLQSREQRLAGLSRRVLEVQELERRAVARELHDEIGQALTALKLMLQRHRQADDCRDPAAIDELIQVADHTLQQVRGLSLDLRPSMLDHLGLAATLRWYVDREAERNGYTATCVIQPERLRLDTSLETTIYRIAQEALTNISRHARASEVAVQLVAHEGTVELSIRDNGPGFDVDEARRRGRQGQSLGLLGMEERAVLAGGTLVLQSGPTGTEVRAMFRGMPL